MKELIVKERPCATGDRRDFVKADILTSKIPMSRETIYKRLALFTLTTFAACARVRLKMSVRLVTSAVEKRLMEDLNVTNHA